MRAPEIFFLARVTRAAMVGSETRKACAISAVDSPHTSRSVSATCASRASAGWQQVKISRSRSSGITPLPSSAPAGPPAPAGGVRLHQKRQLPAQGGVPAQHVDGAVPRRGGQPGAGIARHPLPRPGLQRGDVGVLHALLGQVQVPGDARRRGEHEGPLTTVRVRHGVSRRGAVLPGPRSGAGPGVGGKAARGRPGHMPSKTMIGRTSTPPKRAGHSLPISSAWSRSRASTR